MRRKRSYAGENNRVIQNNSCHGNAGETIGESMLVGDMLQAYEQSVFPDLNSWDNDGTAETEISSMIEDDMSTESAQGLWGNLYNDEGALEAAASLEISDMIPEEEPDYMSNLKDSTKTNKSSNVAETNKEDKGKSESREESFIDKKRNRTPDIKDTSLLNMEELFNKSGVVRKFLFGRACYYNGTHYNYLTEKVFCVICKDKLDRSVLGQITRMQSLKDLYAYTIEYDSSIRETETKENFYISFRNGVVDARSLEFWDWHDPKFEVLFTIDADLDLSISEDEAYSLFNGTTMHRFLENMCNCDLESMKLILQMVGYMLLNVTPKRAFFWLGPAPASGKSILMNVISKLLGKSNCCHINAHQMSERFAQAQLYDCRVNLGWESSGTLNSEAISMIKSLSGDSNISLERKYKSRQDLPNFCKLAFASNEAINIGQTDNSDAFWSRCKLIACLQSCDDKKQDTDLEDKLWVEREAWLPAVIFETSKLIKSGFRFAEPEVSQNLKHQWRYVNEHPVATFVRERLVISSHEIGFVSTQELLDECVKYTGINTMAGNAFSKLLSKYSSQTLIPKKGQGLNGNRVNGYANVQLVDPKVDK